MILFKTELSIVTNWPVMIALHALVGYYSVLDSPAYQQTQKTKKNKQSFQILQQHLQEQQAPPCIQSRDKKKRSLSAEELCYVRK